MDNVRDVVPSTEYQLFHFEDHHNLKLLSDTCRHPQTTLYSLGEITNYPFGSACGIAWPPDNRANIPSAPKSISVLYIIKPRLAMPFSHFGIV